MNFGNVLLAIEIFTTIIVLGIFSMVSAYVMSFRVQRSGLGFDYCVFAIILLIALSLGGVI